MQYYAKIKCITTSDWMEMMLERLCGPTKKKKKLHFIISQTAF